MAESGLFLALNDSEGGKDGGGVSSAKAAEMEVEGVEQVRRWRRVSECQGKDVPLWPRSRRNWKRRMLTASSWLVSASVRPRPSKYPLLVSVSVTTQIIDESFNCMLTHVVIPHCKHASQKLLISFKDVRAKIDDVQLLPRSCG